MIKADYHTAFLMLMVCMLFYNNADSQSIRGDTIFLEVNKVVTVDFPSPPGRYELLPVNNSQDGVYIVNTMGKNSISIHALRKGKDQDLEVTEKDRKHLFILSYKEGSTARKEDLSTKRKIEQRIKEVKKNVTRALNEADSLYNHAKNNIADQASWKDLEAKYQRLEKVVDDNDIEYVKSRLEECRKQSQDLLDMKYGKAIKAGQNYYSTKKYSDARKDYEKALEYKPGDEQALKYKNLNDSMWAKDYVDKGDEANKEKKYIDVKTYYKEALNIKPDYPFLQNKFNQAKKDADPLIYKIEKTNLIQAMKANDIKEARRAYDSALSVYPNDGYTKSQLNKLIIEEKKIEEEEKKEAVYQGILATAKSRADKASNRQEYDLAIKEYQRASDMIPTRKFPKKKIDELTKMKNSVRAN